MNTTKPILGYWAIRGRAQVPRLLFAYAGQQFQNKLYKAPEQWFGNDKNSLGLDFPNLPYLIVDGFGVTEANAISRYIAGQYGKKQLLGKNTKDVAVIDQLVGVIDDMSSSALSLAFSPHYEIEKDKVFTQKIQAKLQQIVKYLGTKDWLLGYLTWADFKLVEAINYMQGIWPNEHKKHENLQRIRFRFNHLPEIIKYYESDESIKSPFLPPTAKWH